MLSWLKSLNPFKPQSENVGLVKDDWNDLGRQALIALAPVMIGVLAKLNDMIPSDVLWGGLAALGIKMATDFLGKLFTKKSE